jgi:hypothetical protein
MKKPLLNLTIQSSELKMLTSISIRLRLYIKFVKIWLKHESPNIGNTSPHTSTIPAGEAFEFSLPIYRANPTSQAQGCKLSDEKPMKRGRNQLTTCSSTLNLPKA